MADRCARCWARGNGNCEVCNYPGPRLGGEDTYPTPHPIPDVRILDHKTSSNARGHALHVAAQAAMAEGIMARLEAVGVFATTPADLDLYETRRMRSAAFRPGHYPADMTKRERHARRLMASAITPGALVHYMGVYAGAIP